MNKRVVRKAEDEWIVVENVFPPLVTEQLWNDAHERLKTRRHESTTGFVNLFAGLLKCDHCGKSLGLSNTKDHSNYYVCNTYKKKGPAKCTSHYLPYDDLYGLVLTEVQRALIAVKATREAFIQSVQAKTERRRRIPQKSTGKGAGRAGSESRGSLQEVPPALRRPVQGHSGGPDVHGAVRRVRIGTYHR